MNVLNVTGSKLYNPSIVKGDGCYVIDSTGKQYIDFESGVWALPLGHNMPRVNSAIEKQLKEISHTSYRFSHPIVEVAATSLLQIMRFEDGKCIFLSSGSEAVEFAVKIVRNVTKKRYLLNLSGYYIAAYGASGDNTFDAFISLDSQLRQEEQSKNFDDILNELPFEEIGGFVFEAGNASGNVKLPPKELIHKIVTKVKEHQGFIIVDEVTVGMGRTGTWFGFEHYDIQPDIIACGKGLGNGYPVSAVGMTKEFFELLDKTNFTYGQSHQNDPLGCAVANEVIATIKDNGLLDKATKMGIYLKKRLNCLKHEHSYIKEVRGIGLLCAIEMDDSMDELKLNSIHKQLFDSGFIVGLKPATKVLRFYPPLIIEESMIDSMVMMLDVILDEVIQN